MTDSPPLPSVAILLDDRLEARELADDLATIVDMLAHALATGSYDETVAGLQTAEEALQRWHERSWAPEVDA